MMKIKDKKLIVEETIPGGIFYKTIEKRLQFNIIHISSEELGFYGGNYTLKIKNDIEILGPKELFISKNVKTIDEARSYAMNIHTKFR
ncbi:MAG: hypothetical protein EAX96_03105 [Candidatus Lokiarchaeota archaeon]|nr:hypothetical protein [Candidatus Lokiarchaeota archaeon]